MVVILLVPTSLGNEESEQIWSLNLGRHSTYVDPLWSWGASLVVILLMASILGRISAYGEPPWSEIKEASWVRNLPERNLPDTKLA